MFDGFIPENFDQHHYIATSAENGKIKCQVFNFQRSGHLEEYDFQLALVCFPKKASDKLNLNFVSTRLGFSENANHQFLKRLGLVIQSSRLHISLELDNGSHKQFDVPNPGSNLQNFEATKKAFKNMDISSLKAAAKHVDFPPVAQDSLAQEAKKQYNFEQGQRGEDYILLEDHQRQYCIDIAKGKAQQYPDLVRGGPGPYTWEISQHGNGQKFTFWGSHEEYFVNPSITQLEFKLEGGSKNGGKIEQVKKIFRRGEKKKKLIL